MPEGRRYSIGAAIADVYVSAMALGVISALYVVAMGRPVVWWLPLIELPVIVVIAVFYHARLARNVKFLSPGERIFGRRMHVQGKQWVNPYNTNRVALFVVFFMAMVVAGNSWDSVSDERLYRAYTLPSVVVRTLLLSILVAGLTTAGSGNRFGGVGMSAYFVLLGVATLVVPPPIEELEAGATAAGYFMLFMGFITAVILSWYAQRRDRGESV